MQNIKQQQHQSLLISPLSWVQGVGTREGQIEFHHFFASCRFVGVFIALINLTLSAKRNGA
jgi:hypothetical protein